MTTLGRAEAPFSRLPWDVENLADGVELTQMVRCHRTLTRTGRGPFAAARDDTLTVQYKN